MTAPCAFYHQDLLESPDALAYLQARRVDHPGALTTVVASRGRSCEVRTIVVARSSQALLEGVRMVSAEVVLLTVHGLRPTTRRSPQGPGPDQQALADRVGIHVSNIRRYEAGTSAPTLDVLRNLALALDTSADSLLSDEDERGPADDLRLQCEAAGATLDEEGKALVRALIEGVMLRHEARRWANAS